MHASALGTVTAAVRSSENAHNAPITHIDFLFRYVHTPRSFGESEMKRLIAAVVVATMLAPSIAFASVGSKNAAYYGGTVEAFNGAKDPVEGKLDTASVTALGFTASDKPFVGKSISIPYDKIIDLEFGQKVGRRVGAAIGYSVLLGPLGLLTLFSKKKNHYLTVGFKDSDGKDQIAVIELGKDIVRSAIPIIETRSGKKVTYQDDEAKKSVK
jgi:hypothetical protein